MEKYKELIDFGMFLLYTSESVHNKKSGKKLMTSAKRRKLAEDMYDLYKKRSDDGFQKFLKTIPEHIKGTSTTNELWQLYRKS